MKIQEVCKITGYTRRNIHFYIQEGLLSPVLSSPNGHYEFTEEDCQRLLLIRILRNANLSIPVIRDILNTPAAAGYYLNQHIKEIKQDLSRLNMILAGLNSVLENLSIEPDISELYRLGASANIPEPTGKCKSDSYDLHDNTEINRYLWASFLPEMHLSEYQEFLWNKINRMTSLPENEDCRKLNTFFHSLDPKKLRHLFRKQQSHLTYIANLDDAGCIDYAEELKERLPLFLEQNSNIKVWKQSYEYFLYPQIRIYDSEISNIAAEMSPMFAAYRKNIHTSCEILYQWLYSEQGETLRLELEQALAPYLDWELSQHGQIEVLANFRQLILGEKWNSGDSVS